MESTIKDHTVVGRTIFADVIYMDVPSRQGSSYAVVMIDSASGFMTGFFVALRSDIPLALSEHIRKMRADPELHCPNFCKKLVVDPAGEWHRTKEAQASFKQRLHGFGGCVDWSDEAS